MKPKNNSGARLLLTIVNKNIAIGLLYLLGMTSAYAFSPVSAPVALIAGEGSAGFQDGAFNEAQFKQIEGLLFNNQTNILYVLDSGNHAVRRVHFNELNRVDTLIGEKGKGFSDGALKTGKLNQPVSMIWGQDRQTILIADRGNRAIRILDLKDQSIKTLELWKKETQTQQRETVELNQPEGLLYRADRQLLMVADGRSIKGIYLSTGETKTIIGSCSKGDFQTLVDFYVNDMLVFTIVNDNTLYRVQIGSEASWPVVTQPQPTVEFGAPITASCTHKGKLFYNLKSPTAFPEQSPLRYRSLAQTQSMAIIDYNKYLAIRSDKYWKFITGQQSGSVQKNRLYATTHALAVFEDGKSLLIGDYTNHRILQLKIPDFQKYTDDFNLYTVEKPVRTKRIVLIGNSLNYVVADKGSLNEEREKYSYFSLFERIEFWLNTLGLIEHADFKFELIYRKKNATITDSLISQAMRNHEAILTKYHADFVLLNYTYEEIVTEALSYLYKPKNGKQVSADVDFEYLLQLEGERDLHPLGKKLFRDIQGNPGKWLPWGKVVNKKLLISSPHLFNMLDVASDRKRILSLMTNRVKEYRKFLKEKSSESDKKELIINLMPIAPNLSTTEIIRSWGGRQIFYNHLGKELEDWCLKNNVAFQECITIIKILEPGMFPLFNTIRDGHYSQRMIDIVAFLTAKQLLEKIMKTEDE
jgi:hypothetical protein